MLYARDTSGKLTTALPRMQGVCPHCDGAVHARCGELKVWHFAHESAEQCDTWAEGETPWHLQWKAAFPSGMIEQTIGEHRADLRVPNGTVVEFQHSPIAPAEIRAREKFYQRMVWIVDASAFVQNIQLFERSGPWEMPDVQFRWQWRRETWKNATCALFLDFTNGLPHDAAADEPRLLWVRGVGEHGFGQGKLVPAGTFIRHVLATDDLPLSKRHSGKVIQPDEFSELRRELREDSLARCEAYTDVKPWEWAEIREERAARSSHSTSRCLGTNSCDCPRCSNRFHPVIR